MVLHKSMQIPTCVASRRPSFQVAICDIEISFNISKYWAKLVSSDVSQCFAVQI